MSQSSYKFYRNYRIEFNIFPDGDLEIRYFDSPRDCSYRSWKLPKKVVEELIFWGRKLGKNKNTFPSRPREEIARDNNYAKSCKDLLRRFE